MALVAQMVERKTLNLVVVGSSPTEGAFFFVYNSWITQYDLGLKALVSGRVLLPHNSFRGAVGSAWVS